MRLLTAREAAEKLTVSTRKVYNLVAAGKLPHYRINNTVRIAEEDIEDYLADCRIARQPVIPEHVEEPPHRGRNLSSGQPRVTASHLKIGPRQLALLRRGGVGTSGPNGRNDG
jgi:excisionase family DNA binding protein